MISHQIHDLQDNILIILEVNNLEYSSIVQDLWICPADPAGFGRCNAAATGIFLWASLGLRWWKALQPCTPQH